MSVLRSLSLALLAAGAVQGAIAAVPPGTPPAPAGVYVTDPAHTSVT